jgi:hypothetical protein
MRRFTVLVVLAISSLLPACSTAQLPTDTQVLSARDKTELAVTLAGQALPLVAAEVHRLVAAGLLTPEQADTAKGSLVQADAMVAQAEAWLAGKADAPGRDEVLAALDAATLAVSVTRTAGGKLPAVVDRAIELARLVVEERR